jgi:hypothetical protein
VVLKDVAASAAPWRKMNARSGIEVQFIVDENPSLIRLRETGKAIER